MAPTEPKPEHAEKPQDFDAVLRRMLSTPPDPKVKPKPPPKPADKGGAK